LIDLRQRGRAVEVSSSYGLREGGEEEDIISL